MKTLDVALGGKIYHIGELTFDQIEALNDALQDPDASALKKIRRQIEIALSLDAPDFKFDTDVRTSLGQITAAHSAILAFAGFRPAEGKTEPGKTEAAAAA